MARKIAHSKKQAAFLTAYALTGNITTAAIAAQIDRKRHYEWLNNDLNGTYAAAFAAAREQAADLLEQEARRRAVEGWDEPVFYQGEPVGAVRKYDSTLLIFLLKGIRPEKYRERAAVEHTGKGGGPIEHRHERKPDLTNLSDEELMALQGILRKAASGDDAYPNTDTSDA